jgi:trehalose 6-phosphate synthase
VVSDIEQHRLTLVSNRGPITYEVVDGERVASRAGGGLVSALRGLIRSHAVTWIACAVNDESRIVAREQRGQAVPEEDDAGNPFLLRLAEPDPADFDRAYHEIANPLLWFIQHELYDTGQSPVVSEGVREAWAAYRRYNATIATAAATEYDADALMVHDYQLYLVPAMLREAGVTTPILHFTHIPWPAPSAWRLLPVDLRTELLHGLLGSDIVGFQTAHDVRNFLATCEEYLTGVTVDHAARTAQVVTDQHVRTVLVRNYPISIDPAEFREHITTPEMVEAAAELTRTRTKHLILRVDRSDPSKNIVRGFHAYDRLLTRRPDLHGDVALLTLLDPSRLAIPAYSLYFETIQTTVDDVNARHARDGWLPIDLRIGDNFPDVIAAYQQYDVLLVNAIADGMNLISKEAPLLNETNGVVVLSDRTGAYEELEPFVLGIDPLDVEATAAQLERAIELSQSERAKRSVAIKDFLLTHDVSRWIDLQLRDLNDLAEARR